MAQPTGLTELGSPVSVSVIDGETLRNAAPQINLSENLGSVPGLQIQNRQNYAQDLQMSIRGFGSRSMFGVRGVRMYVDGIPATMPDGEVKPPISTSIPSSASRCCAALIPRCTATPQVG